MEITIVMGNHTISMAIFNSYVSHYQWLHIINICICIYIYIYVCIYYFAINHIVTIYSPYIFTDFHWHFWRFLQGHVSRPSARPLRWPSRGLWCQPGHFVLRLYFSSCSVLALCHYDFK